MFGIVVGAGKDQVSGSGKRRGLLEQLGIMLLDRGEVDAQLGDEGVRSRIAEEDRDALKAGLVGGKRVSLRVVDHLQAVLETAQKPVLSISELAVRVGATGGGETTQRVQVGPTCSSCSLPPQIRCCV